MPVPEIAASAPATLVLGVGEHDVFRNLPSNPLWSDHEFVKFPARLTNTSNQPVWFIGQSDRPFVRVFTRAGNAESWTERSERACGFVPVKRHQLVPGASVDFPVTVSADHVGQQFRVEVRVYSEPSLVSDSEQCVQSSEKLVP